MTVLTTSQIRLLFTLSELTLLAVARDPALIQVVKLLNDPGIGPLDITDKLFIDSISQLNYLKILTAERTTRVLQGLRPL